MVSRRFGSQKLLAVDWDARDLRVAQLRQRAHGIDLVKAVSVPVPQGVALNDAEAFGDFLREAMRQAGLSAKQALFCVPRDQVVLNTLHLPPTPAEELPSLVQFQIVKELPFAADQAAIDFAIAGPHDPKAPCSALVAAVRNEMLDFYRKVAARAGLRIARAGLRPHANLLSVLASEPQALDKSVMIVDVGPQLTEINFVRSGALTFSRAALVHMPDFGRGEDIADSRIMLPSLHDAGRDEQSSSTIAELMKTVVLTYEAHRANDPSFSADTIVVSGSTGIEPELADSLAARFGTPASLFSPEKALNLAPQRARELRGFSAVLGLALGQRRSDLEKFNFDRVKKPVSRRAVQMRKAPVAVFTAVAFLASAVVAHYKFVRVEWDNVARVEAKIREKQDRERPIKEFAKLVEAVESWRTSEQYWPEAMVALTRALPPDDSATVDLLRFQTSSVGRRGGVNNLLKMKLRVFELGLGNQIADTLRKMGFTDVLTGQETPIVLRGGSNYRYETTIDAQLPPRNKFRKAANLMPVEAPGVSDEPVDADAESAAPEDADAGETPSSEDEAAPPVPTEETLTEKAPAPVPATGADAAANEPSTSEKGARR